MLSFWKENRDGPSDRGFWSKSKSRAYVHTENAPVSQSRRLEGSLAKPSSSRVMNAHRVPHPDMDTAAGSDTVTRSG